MKLPLYPLFILNATCFLFFVLTGDFEKSMYNGIAMLLIAIFMSSDI